ncbi:MAG: protein phosphatase CheZ [Gammaproteobacteria bacterium]|nr:protein phosphatase CheZ [Gammaproteobacteria bacterium]
MLSNNGEVLDAARRLVEQLEANNQEEVSNLISELTRHKESTMFKEIGLLTRQLHDALHGVRMDSGLANLAETDLPEAKERLNYVISMTEQAANKTLNAVEEALPISDAMEERALQLQAEWERFTRRELDAKEFRELSNKVQEFFASVVDDSGRVHAKLNDVLMAQDFQDLTGQVIRRVTDMVQEVEENLVELIRRSSMSTMEEEPEPEPEPPKIKTSKGEGPQMNAEARDDVVSGQDDVDDLLSSLGF